MNIGNKNNSSGSDDANIATDAATAGRKDK